jgi:ribonuclease HI
VFRLSEQESMKVCILLWLVWHERNKANTGDTIRSPDYIASSINYHVNEYRNLKQHKMTQKKVSIQKWSPPPSEFLKINIDGAFYESLKAGGWGFTVRDDRGLLIVAGAGNLEHLSDALHAEALALLYALKISTQMGCVRVIFETDSMMLKQAISSDEYKLAPLGALFQEIRQQLNIAFTDVNLSVCSRSCNNAAHTLAAHGASMGNGIYKTWLGHFPGFVMNDVADDLVSMSL